MYAMRKQGRDPAEKDQKGERDRESGRCGTAVCVCAGRRWRVEDCGSEEQDRKD